MVIYGLENNEGEDEEDTVKWLFADVLKVDVNIDDIERTKPRDTNRIGVIKVELSSVEEKIEVLRHKLKCEDLTDTNRVIIKSCESHDARVNRINNKLLLSLLPKGKEYSITGHGIIKKKEDIKSRKGDVGGNGSDVAENESAEGEEMPAREMGDNEGARVDSGGKQNEKTRPAAKKNEDPRKKTPDQSQQAPKPKADSATNDKQKARGNQLPPAERQQPKRSQRLQSNK